MKIYNKLVRDKIPQKIKASGKEFQIRLISKEEHAVTLEKKLHEEVADFIKTKNIDDLADIMEVVFGIAKNMGYSEEELLNKRLEKREEKGGYEDRVVLEKVWINKSKKEQAEASEESLEIIEGFIEVTEEAVKTIEESIEVAVESIRDEK